jgi:hypothetical protein
MGARGLPVGSFSGVTGMVTPLSSSLFRSLLSNRHPAYGLMVTTTPLQLMTVPRLNVPVCVPVTLTNFASVAAVETDVTPVFWTLFNSVNPEPAACVPL